MEVPMINLRKAGFVPLVALALLLGACGSMNNGGPGEVPPPGPKPMF
jgi:hypothetical protein